MPFTQFINQTQAKYKSSLFNPFSNNNTELLNGSNHKITLGEVFDDYKRLHLSTVTEAVRVLKTERASLLINPIRSLKMAYINPQSLAEFIQITKDNYTPQCSSKRYNFNQELKDLRSILTWYSEHIDFRFISPVKPSHFKIGIIKPVPEKNRKIELSDLKLFFDQLSSLYKDIALIQFQCAGRIGEIAGMQIKNIDLLNRRLLIKDVLVWIKGKPKVKNCPKNGTSREVYINDTMYEIFKKRIKDNKSIFLFHDSTGGPLRYNAIVENYNKAWKRAGLPQYSGTHLLRYASAQSVRKLTGSIDSVMAVTGHKSAKLAEKYSDFDRSEMNKDSLLEFDKLLK